MLEPIVACCRRLATQPQEENLKSLGRFPVRVRVSPSAPKFFLSFSTNFIPARSPPIRKVCDAGRQINHWLLIVCYESGAWSVKIDNKVYDSRYEQSHDVDWYASALRVEPACITRERASGDCDGKKREENTAGIRLRRAESLFPWSLIISLSDL